MIWRFIFLFPKNTEMKKLLFMMLLAYSPVVQAQATKEEDLAYTNNYFTAERFKDLKEKPAALKYEPSGNAVTLTHTGKGTDTYNISELFPRSDYEHSIRDFHLSFNFSLTETSSPDNFFQLTFLVVPDQDIEYKDSVALVMLRIKANGTLYAEYGNMPYNKNIYYNSPALAKDKTWAQVMAADAPANFMKAIPGFKKDGTNKFSLSRTDDHWLLKINDNVLRDWKDMELGYINSSRAPLVTMSGKYTLKMEGLEERYGHQNKSLVKYFEEYKGSGPATMRSSCIKGEIKAYYALTTLYGDPAVRISWRDNDIINKDQVVYFKFTDADRKSTKSFALFNEPGDAREIRMKPEMGEISFDFYFDNSVNIERKDNYGTIFTKTTSKYCTIYISR